MFNPMRQLLAAISAVIAMLFCRNGSRRVLVNGTRLSGSFMVDFGSSDTMSAGPTIRCIARWMRVSRRCVVVFVGSVFLFVVGVMLSGDGDWLSSSDEATTFFRIRWKPRSSADVARLLQQSVIESRSSWRCDTIQQNDSNRGMSSSNLINRGTCRPKDSTLAAASAAHPTVYSTTGIDCRAMFRGDNAEILAARRFMERQPDELTSRWKMTTESLYNLTKDCSEFKRKRGYFTEPFSRAEAEFPIAYSLLMYDNVPQVERLLRAIYMPQNFYCIHIDIKADKFTKNALSSIASCFDNVFIASQLESVFWGHISIIYAEMNCLRDLMRYQWKYFINLSGFMFPAHSNSELVNILQLYDGANDIEGTYKRSDHFWMKVRNTFRWHLSQTFGINLLTLIPKGGLPYNVTIYKGSNQAALTRAFVVHFLYSAEAHKLIDWFADTLAPDEYIWPTLNHNPQLHVPGSYKGDPETKTFTARATVWLPIADQIDWSWKPWTCRGQWVREICIFGVGDLPWLYRRPELFVNKFYADFEPLALDCMEELIYNRTIGSYRESRGRDDENDQFDPTYYNQLPFVSNKSSLIVSLNETLRFLRRG